jgi:hypothetical protein
LGKFEKAFKVAEKARNGSAMTMATIGMARVLGMIIDRREVGEAGAFANYTDEQLIEDIRARAARLGLPAPALVVDNTRK